MKRIVCLVAMLGLAAVGCGNNECEDALDKLDECKVDFGGMEPSEEEAAECNADDECVAKCVNDASCSDINGLLMGMSNSFATCVAACSG